MVKSYLTKNCLETKKLAKSLAKNILKRKPKKAFIIGLVGELGSGKTTFLQGFARGLAIKEKILSPTFILMRKFQIPNPKRQIPKFKTFYHLDCYRISKPREIFNLGFKKIIKDPENIIALEWADKIKEILPQNTLWLKIKFISKEKRQIIIF